MATLWCALAALLISFLAFVVAPTVRGTLGLAAVFTAAVSLVPGLLASCAGGFKFGVQEAMVAVAIGIGIGLPFALILEGAAIPGRLLDTLRGSQHAEVLLPHLESRGSSLEQGLALVLLWIGFAGGGFTAMLTVLHERFALLCAHESQGEWMLPLTAFAGALAQALVVLAPAILLFAGVELGGALLGRVENRGGLWSELPGIRLALGLLAAALVFGQIDGR